jgi:hypothetical protein
VEILSVLIDPRAPTRHRPGTRGKLKVLRARARRKLPLHVTGDRQGTRLKNDIEPSDLSRRSRLERRLIGALSWDKEQDPETLAERTGYKMGQLVLTALGLLCESGLAQRGPQGGWMLAVTM